MKNLEKIGISNVKNTSNPQLARIVKKISSSQDSRAYDDWDAYSAYSDWGAYYDVAV